MNPFQDDGSFTRFLSVVGLFGLFGGLSRILYRWSTVENWARVAGALMSSVFVAQLVGLALSDTLISSRPALLLAIAGAAGWSGGKLAESVVDRLLKRIPGIEDR